MDVDSYSATIPRIGWSGYSIVKAAAQMAARAAAAELANVDVVRVMPGGVRTPLVEGVLRSQDDSPAVKVFKDLEVKGEIIEPAQSGRYLTAIMLDATAQQLAARDIWRFSNPEDHPG